MQGTNTHRNTATAAAGGVARSSVCTQRTTAWSSCSQHNGAPWLVLRVPAEARQALLLLLLMCVCLCVCMLRARAAPVHDDPHCRHVGNQLQQLRHNLLGVQQVWRHRHRRRRSSSSSKSVERRADAGVACVHRVKSVTLRCALLCCLCGPPHRCAQQ